MDYPTIVAVKNMFMVENDPKKILEKYPDHATLIFLFLIHFRDPTIVSKDEKMYFKARGADMDVNPTKNPLISFEYSIDIERRRYKKWARVFPDVICCIFRDVMNSHYFDAEDVVWFQKHGLDINEPSMCYSPNTVVNPIGLACETHNALKLCALVRGGADPNYKVGTTLEDCGKYNALDMLFNCPGKPSRDMKICLRVLDKAGIEWTVHPINMWILEDYKNESEWLKINLQHIKVR